MEQDSWDLDRRVVRANVRARLFGDQRGFVLAGRYRFLSLVGRGAMGVVYAAEDERLGRRVAIKIAGPGTTEPGRLDATLREAKALASLAHPNVLAVFDVGAHEGRLFVAMELVQGQTLDRWLASAPAGWRARLAMFLPAGRGLAAAHAAGLVHRDFKPQNVLVGDDGRVRVADFGLARPVTAAVNGVRGEGAVSVGSGSVAGTPFYMAPEQLAGEGADERSDQFSFCVALYVAIAGGDALGDRPGRWWALGDTPGRGQSPATARPGTMPRWLHRLLLRGMARDPADRHPSMAALIAQLERGSLRRRWRWAGAAAAAVAAVVLVAGVVAHRTGDPCRGTDAAWARVWDGAWSRSVEAAFLRTGAPYARTAWAHVDGALAHHARDGAAAQREACEATRVRGERSEDLLDRRTMCLEAALWDARALVDRFAVADTRTVEHAAPAVHELGGISACADLQALASQARPPADPAVRARVTALRRQLAEATALAATGRTAEARARASALAIEASATGHRPLEAEVLFRRGLLDDEAGDPASAVSALDRAIWAAEASRHDTLAARAWIALMLVRGDRLGHHASALALEPRVTALLERLGGNAALEAELALARARLLVRAARPDDAERAADHARRLLEQRPAPDDTLDDLRVAAAHDLRAAALLAAGRPTEAATALDRALAITRAALGPEHPAVARVQAQIAAARGIRR